MSPMLLLLLAGGALALSTRKKSRFKGVKRVKGFKFTGGFPALQPSLLQLFGASTEDEYPAPYRFEDARELAAIVLRAADETALASRALFGTLVERTRMIDAAAIPNWRKTYALILTVIVPAFSMNLLWHWYRPQSTLKADRFNAIISWCGIFFSMPVTATAAPGIKVDVAGSAFLPNMAAYLQSSTSLRRGSLDPYEQRRCLYDLASFMRAARVATGHGSEDIAVTATDAGQRMAEVHAAYPMSDPPSFVVEGNLRAIGEIVWYANAIVQGAINVEFDEAGAYVALALRIVQAAAQIVSMFIGPQLADAIGQAVDALSALVVLAVDGQITGTQLQAVAGAGVSLMMSQAGIRLGLEDEVSQMMTAGAGVVQTARD